MQITVTFTLGTDLDRAQVLVQNRVNATLQRLPEEVRRLGVNALKRALRRGVPGSTRWWPGR